MSMTGLRSFDQSLTATKEWLKALQEELHFEDQNDAYSALRSVFHALRDRLTVDQAAHLAAQLPLLLKGVFYDQWKPAEQPLKYRSEEEFLSRVKDELGNPQWNPLRVSHAVFKVLEEQVTKGEIEKVKHELPPEIEKLWPQRTEP